MGDIIDITQILRDRTQVEADKVADKTFDEVCKQKAKEISEMRKKIKSELKDLGL